MVWCLAEAGLSHTCTSHKQVKSLNLQVSSKSQVTVVCNLASKVHAISQTSEVESLLRSNLSAKISLNPNVISLTSPLHVSYVVQWAMLWSTLKALQTFLAVGPKGRSSVLVIKLNIISQYLEKCQYFIIIKCCLEPRLVVAMCPQGCRERFHVHQ